jgi:hypothetical protein
VIITFQSSRNGSKNTSALIRGFDMDTADKWADSKSVGGGTVQSKQAEREELARKMAEFEARRGPVKTTPIMQAKEIEPDDHYKASRDRANKKSRKARQHKPVEQREIIFRLVCDGVETIGELAQRTTFDRSRVKHLVYSLRDKNKIVAVKKGKYRAVGNVENC